MSRYRLIWVKDDKSCQQSLSGVVAMVRRQQHCLAATRVTMYGKRIDSKVGRSATLLVSNNAWKKDGQRSWRCRPRKAAECTGS